MSETDTNDTIRSRRTGRARRGQWSEYSTGNSITNDDYCKQLSSWIYQCYYYHYMSSMVTIVAQTQSLQQTPMMDVNRNWTLPHTEPNVEFPQLGRIYAVPRLWKRVAAEVIDFLFLLILKLMVTYIAVDYLNLIDFDKFDLNLLDSSDFDAFEIAYELTSEIIIIEMIHRFIVVAYETVCLSRGQLNRTGGATPGKAIFGISVVSCDRIDDVGDGLIRVIPANNIGVLCSLLRALIKNLSAVFFIPASLTVFVSSHNRAAYDIACKCIVVEDIGEGIGVSRVRPRRN